MSTRNNTVRESARDMSAVRPSWSAALASVDPAALAALLRRVHLVARGYRRADEVESLAAVTVAGFYDGNVERAALAACRAADKAVTAAYAGVDSLDAWSDAAPEYVESRAAATDLATGLPRAWSPTPDARYATTDTDVIVAALASVEDDDARRILTDASRAYLAHGDRRCHTCETAGGRGRAVSLTGILAHTRRVTADDSEYHRLRRLMVAALHGVDVAGVKAEHYYGRPSIGGGAVSLTREPRHEAPGKVERAARSLPDTDAVTVRTADGASHVTTHARIVGKAPERTPEDRRADLIGEAIAGAPSRAVARQERARGNGGTGAYGPQVPARLTRG